MLGLSWRRASLAGKSKENTMTTLTQPAAETIRDRQPDRKHAAATTHRPLQVRSFGATTPGKVRSNNEDQFLIAQVGCCLRPLQSSLHEPEVQCAPEQGFLFLVADGMGGHRAGEEASSLAVECVKADLLRLLPALGTAAHADPDGVEQQLKAALRHANAFLWETAHRNPQLWGMGTTLTLACYLEPHLFLAHTGDSRCYLARAGRLHRLTRDHTLAQALVDQGRSGTEELTQRAWGHILTSTVGGTDRTIHVDTNHYQVEPGDELLLCSDGLTDLVGDSLIQEVLQAGMEPRLTCRRLLQLANDAGGRDNITAVVAHFDPAAPREGVGL